jgi:hypothetical protein
LRRIDQLCHQVLLGDQGRPQCTIEENRADTPANETLTTAHLHIERLAVWATHLRGMWSGTAAELAAATGISAEDVSYVVEDCSTELSTAGIAVAVERSPGKPRMITLSHLECEPPRESSSGDSPQLHEADAGVQPRGLPENPPELHEVQSRVPREHTSEELQTEPQLDQTPAGEARPDAFVATAENPSAKRRPWQAAGILAATIAIAGGLLYLQSSSSEHQGSPVRQRAPEPTPPSRMDDGSGTRKTTPAGEIDPQSTHRQPVLPDHEKVNAYEQAATQGDAVAQHRLGVALSSGANGVAADRVAGYAWLVMAHDGGEPIQQTTLDSLARSLTAHELLDVRYKLGMMHEHGIGCSPDPILADVWFLLGAAGGDARSRAESAALEKRMSRDQISQAHARSDNWLRRHSVKPTTNAVAR